MTGKQPSRTESLQPILIAGGSGFVGSSLQRALKGQSLRILARHAPRERSTTGDENIEHVRADLTDPSGLDAATSGCRAVINLVAIIEEANGGTFDGVIRQGSENLIAAAKRSAVKRFLYVSALGARNDPDYPYFIAKWRAEVALKASGLEWTIVRPSIVFGQGDGFISVLADVVRQFPVIPVAGTGRSLFQPIAVDDLTASIAGAVDDRNAVDKTYDLGGPDILSYEQLLDIIAAKLGKKKPKIHVPVAVLKPLIALSRPLPKQLRPPVTKEQLKMLAIDNCSSESATSQLLGRPPKRLEDNIDYIV